MPNAAPQPQFAMPDAENILILVRTSLLTLNDALATGNYTVLRDLGAPSFREANTAARLGDIFSGLANQGVNLVRVATAAPQLAEAPAIDPTTNVLTIRGWFPAPPLQLNFALQFQPVGGRWRLLGISVVPTVPPATPGNVPAAAQQGEKR